MKKTPRCAIHDKELVCLSCRAAEIGKLGGRAKSKKKAVAAKRNAKKPRSRAEKERPT